MSMTTLMMQLQVPTRNEVNLGVFLQDGARMLDGHQGGVYCVALDGGGHRGLSGSRDGGAGVTPRVSVPPCE